MLVTVLLGPLSANPTKWSNTVKQFVGNNQQIVWVCLTNSEMIRDISNKDMYDSKILEAISHIKNIIKKKPAVDNIHKYLENRDL